MRTTHLHADDYKNQTKREQLPMQQTKSVIRNHVVDLLKFLNNYKRGGKRKEDNMDEWGFNHRVSQSGPHGTLLGQRKML